MGWMTKFTLLDAAVRGFRGVPAEGWVGQPGRQRQRVGLYVPGGERRLLFGVGEGPTEAVAEAKQGNVGMMRKRFDGELVTEPWLLNGSTQAGVRHKMRNNDLRFGYGHASVTLRSAS